MKNIKALIIGSALGLITLTGTAIKTTANSLPNSSSLKVVKVQSALPTGTIIGERKCSDGGLEIFKPTCGEISINDLSEEAVRYYIEGIEHLLNRAGYRVFGKADRTSVFANYTARPEQTPDYLIGLTIVDAEIDSKQGMKNGNYYWRTLGRVITRWEVFDTKHQKVILVRDITSEKIEVPGERIAPLVQQAIKQATNDFFSISEVQLILK